MPQNTYDECINRSYLLESCGTQDFDQS